jgi:hypothetical protein
LSRSQSRSRDATARKTATLICRIDVRLHAVIMAEIAKLSPETAEAIVIRLGQVTTEWGG